MASLYARLKPVYRRVIPVSVRRLLSRRDLPFHGPVNAIKGALERRASDAEIYDRSYFEGAVEAAAASSAPHMADSLLAAFHPGFVIDVGCGTGALMQQFLARGVRCLGFENADAALAILRERGLDARKVDLEADVEIDARADLVVSTEVAEHLPPRFADRFVDLLCRLSDNVVMTAATPGQGGTDHVNEQPHEYWIAKFQHRGFRFESDLSNSLREEWRSLRVIDFYWKNLMAFRRV